MLGKTLAFCIATVSAVPVRDLALDLLGGARVDVIARGAADRVERFDQRHAGGEHGRQRARPARDRRLAHQVAEHRQLEHHPVHEDLHRERALPRLEEAVDAAEDDREDDVPVGPPGRVQHAVAGDGRRPVDRQLRPQRRLPQHDPDHDHERRRRGNQERSGVRFPASPTTTLRTRA